MTRTHRMLLVLLGVQTTFLATVWSRRVERDPAPAAERFLIGERFAAVPIGAGRVFQAADSTGNEWSLVLAFSASCLWCDSVAPVWELLTGAELPSVRLIGVTQDEPAVAAGYVAAHRWRFDALLAGAEADPGSPGGQLTARTPWYYLFDPTGTLRRTGHGATAAEAVQELVPQTTISETAP